MKGGVILPYRRLGVDISFPNLVEGTCREASCTYHSKSCGHFPGGKTVRGHGRRDEDFPDEKVSGLKGVGDTPEHKRAKLERENGKEKKKETQKSLLIRFPGYYDLECHPSWIYRFRNGSQKEEGREEAPKDSLYRDAG